MPLHYTPLGETLLSTLLSVSPPWYNLRSTRSWQLERISTKRGFGHCNIVFLQKVFNVKSHLSSIHTWVLCWLQCIFTVTITFVLDWPRFQLDVVVKVFMCSFLFWHNTIRSGLIWFDFSYIISSMYCGYTVFKGLQSDAQRTCWTFHVSSDSKGLHIDCLFESMSDTAGGGN